ncbi:hypothetical protein [Pseudoalteromonas piratica]|uniref:Solute-binding protein family 3/N-terminal domain-containing protein n=1 Tax=Pseudoalteromonas piratica TaxID=1348114 RepID=A0A0A7EKK4_9GAMM|nr:hypothetical protein [Pseudoalteromonas piratica]AIY67210.1 hypothetical protein OM33_19320 [Pseudoalteromonas piratica]
MVTRYFYTLIICISLHINAKVVDITVETDIYFYAKEIIDKQPILEITDYSGKNAQRDVVEFILVQQALLLGGADIKFNFIYGNYDARNLKLLNEGLLLLSFDSLWLSATEQYQDNLYISEPVIAKGEYFAGIFTAESNLKRFSNNTFSINDLSMVSSKDWHVDWITLQALMPKKLIHESDWIVMAKMVSRGWVDGMLAPFKKQKNFSYIGPDYKIVAIPNVKVALEDSRHFVVSKNHPLGKETFEALQRGLKILRQRGLIEKAYRQAGFINDDVSNWRTISPKVNN